MSQHDVIAIGASAGGLEALKVLVAQLPPQLPAAVLVVQHTAPDAPSYLPDILAAAGALPAAHARDGEELQTGRIYVAPPDHHLMLDGRHVRVTRGPRENRSRPAVDVLFRSAAVYFGSRAIGVVLSGSLDDGASGLYAIKDRGGVAVVQDPSDALYPEMPRNALQAVAVDHVVPASQMGHLLTQLAQGNETPQTPQSRPETEAVGDDPVSNGDDPVSKMLETEVAIAQEAHGLDIGVMELGKPSVYTCPECHGILLQIKEGTRTRFRCHTGHAFSLKVLLAEVTQSIEDSLWNTLRAIEESQMMLSHLQQHLQESNQKEAAQQVGQKLEETKQRAEAVRQLAVGSKVLSPEKMRDDQEGFTVGG